MRLAAHTGGKPDGGGEHRAHNVIRSIPFPEVTAVEHREHGLRILLDDVARPDIVVLAVGPKLAHAAGAAAAATVDPEVLPPAQQRDPPLVRRRIVLHVGLNHCPWANERREVAIARCGAGQAAFVADAVAHERPTRNRK